MKSRRSVPKYLACTLNPHGLQGPPRPKKHPSRVLLPGPHDARKGLRRSRRREGGGPPSRPHPSRPPKAPWTYVACIPISNNYLACPSVPLPMLHARQAPPSCKCRCQVAPYVQECDIPKVCFFQPKSQQACSSADLLQHWLTGICYSGVPVEGCMRICVDEPDSHEDGVDECAAACHGRFSPLHLASLDLDRITTRPSVVGT